MFREPFLALCAASATDAEVADGFSARVVEPRVRAFADRIRAAQRAGVADGETDPSLAAEVIVGSLMRPGPVRDRPMAHAYADGLVDLVLAGLLIRA